MKLNRHLIMVGPDPNGLGGISRVIKLWKECNLLPEYKVHYITSVSDDFESFSSKINCLIVGLLILTKLFINGVSVVYVHTSSYNSFYRKSLFIFFAIIFRKKVTLHIHPTHFYEFITGTNGLKKWYIFYLLNQINNFIVLTNEMKKKIRKLFPDKPVHVLSNPVNIESLAISEQYGRADNKLLYLGWYVKEKGIYDLVDAVEILAMKGADAHLEFYGTKEISALKDYVKKKNLDSEIKVNDWIKDREKIEVLHKCTMLILPSHSEGMPNVILEAMATKTPIVATHVGGLKEVLNDGDNALIAKVKNPKDLSDKILRCLEDKNLRQKIATKGFLDAKTKYDIPVIKTKFEKIMDEILT